MSSLLFFFLFFVLPVETDSQLSPLPPPNSGALEGRRWWQPPLDNNC